MSDSQKSKVQKIIDIIQWVLIVCLLGWICYIYIKAHNTEKVSGDMVYKDAYTYQKIYESQTIESLRETNRELYDSIAKLKNVESAVIIKYKYKYQTDTIREMVMRPDSIYQYCYNNDTVHYHLEIKAQQVDWHKLDFSVNEKLFLTTQEKDGNVITTATHSPNIEIDSISTFHRKKTWKEHFHFGPQVGVGYGIFTKKPDLYLGIGVMYEF